MQTDRLYILLLMMHTCSLLGHYDTKSYLKGIHYILRVLAPLRENLLLCDSESLREHKNITKPGTPMYIPNSFAETDTEKLHQFIQQYSFSTLVSQEGTLPVASHLPLLLDRNEGLNGKLIGHMARANPQWQTAAGQSVLAIFHGPHAYISPTWYEATNVVPTWNYVAVHAYGTLQLVTDRHHLLEILQKYVDFYESNMPQPWSLAGVDTDFIDNLTEATVGFEIVIDKIEGKAKLSQNQEEPRQEKVIQALRASTADNNQQIANLMSQRLSR